MKVAFKDDSFAFEFIRNPGFTYYGGADIGEMIATAETIKEVWNMIPERASAALKAGDAVTCEKIISEAMQTHTTLRWAVTQGIWSFGSSGFADFVAKSEKYTMKGLAARIKCPCLVLEAESDLFFKGQPRRIHDVLKAGNKH